ncbi:WhiB family transcriptional regulator [Streptosporangium roseum]|uniref:WhiB family transcriptional regulator n=1 Tax=Streptosporangium roseum TaxID=2001 RepID=UPI0033322B43
MSRKAFLAQTWDERAKCKGMDVGIFYEDDADEPRSSDSRRPTYDEAKAKKTCARCPVRDECLQDALDRKDFHGGVHGGLNAEELRAERRRRMRRASDARAADLKTEQEVAA